MTSKTRTWRAALAAVAATLAMPTAVSGANQSDSNTIGGESAVSVTRTVRGSCAESYLPIFRAAREVRFEGEYARLAVSVKVDRDPATGVVKDARPEAVSVSGLPDDQVAAVLAGVKAAYLSPEQEDCRGVVTSRTDWVLRFGEKSALAAPDDPLVMNRATASTPLRQRSGAVELFDPTTGRTRLTRLPVEQSAEEACYAAEIWRDSGPLPPVRLMPRGARYRLTFFVEPSGRATRVTIDPVVGGAPDATLQSALEAYVTQSRFYPPITEKCRSRNAVASIFVGRD